VIRFRRLLVLFSLFAGAGCYSLRPVSTGVAPEVGTRIDVELNDAGRATLAPAIGAGVDRIDGMLVEQDSAGMTLAVKHMISLDGSVQVWSNEPVRIENSQVRTISERHFSAARTVAFGAAGVAGTTFMFTKGLALLGLVGDGDTKGDTTGQQLIRVIRP